MRVEFRSRGRSAVPSIGRAHLLDRSNPVGPRRCPVGVPNGGILVTVESDDVLRCGSYMHQPDSISRRKQHFGSCFQKHFTTTIVLEVEAARR